MNNERLEIAKKIALLILFTVEYARSRGYSVVLGELKRTKEQQEIYFKQGKTKTMNSKHLQSRAIDIYLVDENNNVVNDCEAYREIAEYCKSLGGNAGYFWKMKDCVHFEF
ncbi:MAG: M15 family metallopeptidase [Brevundimonas sp.]